MSEMIENGIGVKEMMENVHPLSVPLLVEIGVGPNWRDLD